MRTFDFIATAKISEKGWIATLRIFYCLAISLINPCTAPRVFILFNLPFEGELEFDSSDSIDYSRKS